MYAIFFFYQTDGEGMGYCPDVLSHCRSHVQYVRFNYDFKNIKWVFLIFNFQLRASFEKKSLSDATLTFHSQSHTLVLFLVFRVDLFKKKVGFFYFLLVIAVEVKTI